MKWDEVHSQILRLTCGTARAEPLPASFRKEAAKPRLFLGNSSNLRVCSDEGAALLQSQRQKEGIADTRV